MPEQDTTQAPAEPDVQDTPTPGTPATPDPQQGTPEDASTVDWQKRYSDLQPEYTRATQEASELRQYQEAMEALQNDPEAQKAFFAELVDTYGVDALNEWLPDDEEPESDDPLSAFDSRLQAIEHAESQREASAQAAQLEAQLNTEIDTLSQAEGVKFTADERELLLDTTVTAMLQTNQAPDVKGAYQRLNAAYKANQERYLASKNPGGTPPPAGPAGSPDIDLKDPDKRRERGVAVLQALEG